MKELPKGWIQTELEQVGEITTGNTPPKKEPDNYDNDYPWVKPTDLDDGDLIIKTNEYLSKKGAKKARLLEPETVMVSCIGILGKVGFAGTKLATNQQINSITFNKQLVIPRYGFFYCKTISQWMYDNASATTVSIINKTRFSKAPFLLPPINEQRRIVAKLEKILSKVNSCCDHLERIPTILKRFRQSVLAAACSGRLTADWRENNPNIESAEELLKRIQIERKKRYEEECEKAKKEGKRKPKNQDENKRSNKPVIELPEIPETWCFSRLEQLSYLVTDGTHKTPIYQDEGIKFLSVKNVRPFLIKDEDIKYISHEEYEFINSRCNPEKGDILYTKVGATFGYAAVNDLEYPFSIFVSLALIKPVLPLFCSKYAEIIMNSEIVFAQARDRISGIGTPDLHLIEIRDFRIPLPPLEEQEEIVRRVEALFKKCDAIEQRYLKAKAYTDKLTQSILAKAFRGELVPQDPNDEPAEVLLERIRAEKAQQEKPSKTKKTKQKATTTKKKSQIKPRQLDIPNME